MSLARENDLYQAYCNLCFHTGKNPLRKSKWRKQNTTTNKQNKTVEDILRELDEVNEHA